MKKSNNKFQVNLKNGRGITLVALVITIVILIILAVVAINAVFGDSGLLQYAQDARNYQANADSADAGMINSAMEYIDGIIGGNSGEDNTPTIPSTVAEAKPDEGENIYYFENTTELEDDSGDSVWIPGGFGVTEDSSTDADDGVVIQDKSGNQFVWIPVLDYTTMYEEIETPIQLSGSDVGVNTTTDVYSKLRIRSGDSYIADIPNSTNVRETDILIDTVEGDASTESGKGLDQIKNVLGITGDTDTEVLNNYANSLVEEYKATYNSIKKYKGFYIGRYELTGTVDNPTVQKGQEVLTADIAGNWYYLKKACTNLVSSEYAQTTMVYGNQWDEVMSWLVSTGAKTDAEVNEDSSSWGNYNTASGGTGSKQVSGYSETWKANNIYDLAGNCWEWTQEAYSNNRRVGRGGNYYDSDSTRPASDRGNDEPTSSINYDTSRPTLYIK